MGGIFEDVYKEAQPTNPDLPERCTYIALFIPYLSILIDFLREVNF
jgi:hypothetical protein